MSLNVRHSLCIGFLLILVGCFAYGEKGREDVLIEQVTQQFGLAEGPHWDHRTQKLYFVDIYGQKICRLDPATGRVTCTRIENGPVGVAIPVNDEFDKLVAGAGTDFVVVSWDGETDLETAPVKVLAKVDTDREGTRWNDGKVDSAGRFWGGTMGHERDLNVTPDQGSLYLISGNDMVPQKKFSPVTISNGLAWNTEDNTMYYIDSLTYQVVAFDFDPHAGAISGKRVIFDLQKNNITGLPDGMTIDTDGNLWVAVYGGGRVLQINPTTGELLRTVELPAERVTSVTFGGPLLDILYVTTSSYGMNATQLEAQPKAGCLFSIKNLGVRGMLANTFKMNQ